MSTENNAAAGQVYGRVERETKETVIFTSEHGRRIRFRYIRDSLLHSNALVFQCTQCRVTALLRHGEFRIEDPCAGHNCSVGASRPQWTPATGVTTALSAQQSPATTALAYRSSSHAKNAQKVIAKATYNDGSVTWPSERYPGITFTFRPNKSVAGRRRYFSCRDCSRKCDMYTDSLDACGIKRRCLIVLGDSIVDYHPDDAGTNKGHLCQQPLLEEKLKKAKEALESTAEPSMDEIVNDGNQDTKAVPKIKLAVERSTKLAHAREAKKPSVSCAETDNDNTFGKAGALSASTLTEAERLVWSSAPSIIKGPLRGKELIAYRSQEHKRRFKFVLAGQSSLEEHAFDYFCLDCWIKHEEECRVTVRGLTQEFVITDPDRTSAGRHACMQGSLALPGPHAVAKEPLRGLPNAEAKRLPVESANAPLVEAPAQSMEYFSEHYQATLKFILNTKRKYGKGYYVCAPCRTLQALYFAMGTKVVGKMKSMGYHRFGYAEIRLHLAVVVGGRFVERPPDECGVELLIGDAVERRHICRDDKLKKLVEVEGSTNEANGATPPKQMRHTVLTSISVGVSRAGTLYPQDDADPTPTDQRVDAQAEFKDSAVDQADTEQPTTKRDDGGSRQSEELGLGPTVDAHDEALQHEESTYSASSTARHAVSPHESEANVATAHFDVDEEQKSLRFDERREADSMDQSNNPTAGISKTNGATRFVDSATTSGTRKRIAGSSGEVKAPTKKPVEVVTIDDSDDGTDANGASCASKKGAKREPAQNTDDSERNRAKAAKFHRFIEEFGFVDEYALYSAARDSGEPTAFITQRHVMEKWIQFNQRD